MKKRYLLIIVLLAVLLAPILEAQTWSILYRLTWKSFNCYEPTIAAAAGGSVHVAWYDSSSGGSEIYYKRSTDGGSNWLSPKRLSYSVGFSIMPSIAAGSSGDIHIVWNDYVSPAGPAEILYKKSTNSGANWLARIRLTYNSTNSFNPVIAVSQGGTIHVAWGFSPSGKSEVFYKRSTDGGSIWSARKRLTYNTGYSSNPFIAANSGGGVFIVWSDNSTGNYEIYFKRSTDGGVTWSSLNRLTWNTGSSVFPRIAASGSNLHLVFNDDTPANHEIFYKNSTDSGATWSALKRITWGIGWSEIASVVTDSGSGVHVVWEDNVFGNWEIIYRNSTDGGNTWLNVKRLSWNAGDSERADLAADPSGGIHVTWFDDTPGYRQIFYKNRK